MRSKRCQDLRRKIVGVPRPFRSIKFYDCVICGVSCKDQANHGLDGFGGLSNCTVSEPLGQNRVKNYEPFFGHNMVDVCIIREGEKVTLSKSRLFS